MTASGLGADPHRDRLEAALGADDPTEALRAFALELAAAGLRRRQVFEIFHAFDLDLQREEREHAAALVGDVLDMISQWYSGRSLDIPE